MYIIISLIILFFESIISQGTQVIQVSLPKVRPFQGGPKTVGRTIWVEVLAEKVLPGIDQTAKNVV